MTISNGSQIPISNAYNDQAIKINNYTTSGLINKSLRSKKLQTRNTTTAGIFTNFEAEELNSWQISGNEERISENIPSINNAEQLEINNTNNSSKNLFAVDSKNRISNAFYSSKKSTKSNTNILNDLKQDSSNTIESLVIEEVVVESDQKPDILIDDKLTKKIGIKSSNSKKHYLGSECSEIHSPKEIESLKSGTESPDCKESDIAEPTNTADIIKCSTERMAHLKKLVVNHKVLNHKLLNEITDLVTPLFQADKDHYHEYVNRVKLLTPVNFSDYDVPSGVSLFHSGRPSVNINVQSIHHQFKPNQVVSAADNSKARRSPDDIDECDLWITQKKKICDDVNYFGGHLDELQRWDSIDIKHVPNYSLRPTSSDECNTIIFPRNRQKNNSTKFSVPAPPTQLGGLGPDKESESYQKGVSYEIFLIPYS